MGWSYIVIPERKENNSSCDLHGNGNTEERRSVTKYAVANVEFRQDNSHTGIEIVLQSVSVYQIKCPRTMEGLLTQPTANPSAGSTQRAAVEGNKFPDLTNNRLCALPKCGKVPEIGAQVVISPTAHKELRKRKWI